MNRNRLLVLLSLITLASACDKKEAAAPQPVLTSLLGKEYFEPSRSPSAQARLDSNLNVAKANWEKDPSEDNYIWYGRRLGYLMRLKESVDVFSEGIQKFPESYKLYRHRGHRFISLRQFDNAIADLEKARQLMPAEPLETEPDGAPNKLNTPLSSTQFNILYHLALAHYLKKDFAKAEEVYKECMKTSINDDLVVATVDWLYMTYRREGKTEEAKQLLTMVRDSMNIIENDSYLKRIRMYQGTLPPDSVLTVNQAADDADLSLATQGYGVGNWYLYNGDSAKASEIFEKVVAGNYFAAFGFIAAEAELAGMK